MKKSHLMVVVGACTLSVALGYGLYSAGLQRGLQRATAPAQQGTVAMAPAAHQAVPQTIPEGEAATRRHMASGIQAGDTDPVTGVRVLYYHDPMVPGNKFDKPAKSPFMDMMLVPVYADGGSDQGSDQGSVTVSARVQQNLGIRTAAVVQDSLVTQLSVVGSIAFNERAQAVVQARAAGFVQHLYVGATLDSVAKGQPLVDLYVPDWVGAQEEFLALTRMQGQGLGPLVDAARQRMRLLGMSDAQIAAVERSGKPQAQVTITAPLAGVVSELMVREGMAIAAGATLFRINALSSVWANSEVPEAQAAFLHTGGQVQARSPALPGRVFEGRVQAVVPSVNTATRTLTARVELANPGTRLVPGMLVTMVLEGPRADKRLLVPTEAVITTGKRSVVILAQGEGRFRPVDVEVGLESGGRTEIRHGLQLGQQVVVSSQFLIDSEASLKGVEERLNESAPPSMAPMAMGSKP